LAFYCISLKKNKKKFDFFILPEYIENRIFRGILSASGEKDVCKTY